MIMDKILLTFILIDLFLLKVIAFNQLNPNNDLTYNDHLNALNDDDFLRGRMLSSDELFGHNDNIINDSDEKLLYNPKYFEGDIIKKNSEMTGRNIISELTYRWPNGRVPYSISGQYSEGERSLIARAIEDYHNKTCIRFVPKRFLDFSYLYINPGPSCASEVGRMGGVQMLSLGKECIKFGVIQHELMHALGFWHEQSRPDRDEYVRINWDNIEKGLTFNFAKFSWSQVQNLSEPYDYGSLLHYGTHAFSKGFGATLSALKDVPEGIVIGQRDRLSDLDLRKINKLYNCLRYNKIRNF